MDFIVKYCLTLIWTQLVLLKYIGLHAYVGRL